MGTGSLKPSFLFTYGICFLGNDRQVAFALRSCFLGTLRLLGAEETPSMGAMPDTSLKQICGFSDFKKALSQQR